MTHKTNLWASARTHDPFFDNPKIWPTFIYRGEMWKKTLFLSLFVEKRGQIGKKSKKNCCGHQLRTMTYFSTYHTFDPLLYLGCQMLQTLFFFTFSAKTVQITRYLGKKTYGHQLGPMTHFLTNLKFDLLLYIGEKCLRTHLQSFLCMP